MHWFNYTGAELSTVQAT